MIVNATHWDQRIYQERVSEEDADTIIEVIQVVGNRSRVPMLIFQVAAVDDRIRNPKFLTFCAPHIRDYGEWRQPSLFFARDVMNWFRDNVQRTMEIGLRAEEVWILLGRTCSWYLEDM